MQRAFLTCPVLPDRLVPGSRSAQSITTLDALITAAHLATSPGSMGTMFDAAFRRFAGAFERRADLVYAK